MFYSHSFLARKGPLATVWLAAHLQHRMKKPQYVSTNVQSSVERIMDPEVPIALRMAGHLLLGVVRIYSKQVFYLYEECETVRITINRVYKYESVNLPEDATLAPYHSVTLPESFELDAIELDEFDKILGHDSHIVNNHEITLIEIGRIPTIAFELEPTLRSPGQNLGSGPVPMEEDVPAVEVDAGEHHSSPITQVRTGYGTTGTRSPQELPSIEVMRDAVPGFDFTNSPILPDRAEADNVLLEQINKDKETNTPQVEEVDLPGGSVLSPQTRENPPSSGHLDAHIPFENQSPDFQIPSQTPPAPPAAPPVVRPAAPAVATKPQRKRKRKQFFDENIILSNRTVQRGLEDTSDILRKRKNCPSSSLAIWKLDKRLRLRKDPLFVHPLVSGTYAELQELYTEGAVSAKSPPVAAEEPDQEVAPDQPSLPRHGDEMEAEPIQDEYASPDRQIREFPSVLHSPDRHIRDFSTVLPSPSARGYSTPQNSNFGIQSERLGATEMDEVPPTAGTGMSSGMGDSDIRTPDSFYGRGLQMDHTALSDIPELAVASPGELGFLEQEVASPPGSQETPQPSASINQTSKLQPLSSRTRAVAQYLIRQSPATPVPGSTEESSEDLSLNKILEGKTRKICARMFFETLVLKSHNLVDVQQEVPYGDITLKVTPNLSKEQFTS